MTFCFDIVIKPMRKGGFWNWSRLAALQLHGTDWNEFKEHLRGKWVRVGNTSVYQPRVPMFPALEIAPPRNIPIILISSIRPGIHGRGPKNEKGVQGDQDPPARKTLVCSCSAPAASTAYRAE